MKKIFANVIHTSPYFASLNGEFDTMEYFQYSQPFPLESGRLLPGLTIAYKTYGSMNAAKSNIVWVCHALTANADTAHWWPGLIGEQRCIDPANDYIVCANILGSCYGSTGPLSINPASHKPYYSDFPLITIRDMVRAHILLRQHLGIDEIRLLMGGSMGGYQVLEWGIMEKEKIRELFLIATSPTESAWGIAIHTAQRLAIEADASWRDHDPEAGKQGLKAARAMGILTYRNYGVFEKKQHDPDAEKMDHYKASSYVNYQGDKLVARFNAYSYWLLTKAMDSHHIARGRGGNVDRVLNQMQQKTLIIGISTDILCPLDEQRHMSRQMPHSKLVEIDSAYGHDGFMVEAEKISLHLKEWMS